MTFSRHTAANRIFFFMLAISVALPGLAAQRRRAVQLRPAVEVTLSGVVTDADSGAPVVQAEIAAASRMTSTDTSGRYSFKVPAGTSNVTISRTGYETLTQLVTAPSDLTKNFTVKSKPTVTMRLTSGQTIALDADTIEFGFPSGFSYVRGQHLNVCRGDTEGKAVETKRADIKKITGPATRTQFTPCCTSFQIETVNVELRNGQSGQAYLYDSCPGYEIEVVGRNHATAEFMYVKFANISELLFP